MWLTDKDIDTHTMHWFMDGLLYLQQSTGIFQFTKVGYACGGITTTNLGTDDLLFTALFTDEEDNDVPLPFCAA